MGRPKTPSLPATDADTQIFRDRLEEMLPLAFPKIEGDTNRIKALSKRCGVGAETIRKAMKGERSPTLSILSAIARGLGISLSQLFSPVPISAHPRHPEGRRRDEGGPDRTRPD